MIRKTKNIAAFTVAVCLLPGTLKAASLEFIPNRLAVGQGQAATIELRSHGSPTMVQVRAYKWTQNGDHDELVPTNDIVVSPPISQVQGSQVLRLLNRGGGASGESAYRLIFDEIPAPQTDRRAVVFALRASVPVFVATPANVAEALEWRAQRTSGGISLQVSNTGPRAARISDVTATLSGGASIAAKPAGKNPYVLSGSQRHWLLPIAAVPSPGTVIRLRVATEAGSKNETVTIQ